MLTCSSLFVNSLFGHCKWLWDEHQLPWGLRSGKGLGWLVSVMLEESTWSDQMWGLMSLVGLFWRFENHLPEHLHVLAGLNSFFTTVYTRYQARKWCPQACPARRNLKNGRAPAIWTGITRAPDWIWSGTGYPQEVKAIAYFSFPLRFIIFWLRT